MIYNIINNFPKLNEKYPNINYGGCGTFSYHLYKVLKDKYNIDTEIVYIKTDHAPGGKPDYDLKFSHIMLKYTNKDDTSDYTFYIDNNGVYKYLPDIIETLSLSKLEEMISIPELWNNKFNHSMSDDLKRDLYLL
jgi:hypothetical protein